MAPRPFYVLTILAAVLSAAGARIVHSGRAYISGDCPYYAATCESVLRDGDFNLLNNLTSSGDMSVSRSELVAHEGFFAISPDDVVVPKHSTLMPLLTVPFFWLFGVHGFLVFNVVVAVLLVCSVAVLAGGTDAARATALVLFVTSSWLGYCFNYSPDLFAALLITASFGAARWERWWLCGLFAGLAVWAKVYAAVILLPMAIVVLPAGIVPTLKAIVGSLVGIVPMLVINHVLYGGPLVTGYDRDARVAAVGFTVHEHYSLFNQPMLTGLMNVLFDLRAGMLRTAPLWFLWPVGLWMILRHPTVMPRRFAVVVALAASANVLLFARYECWDASTDGNRFLFPAVALGGALLEPLMARAIVAFTGKSKAR